jgi:hypothetical protein
MVALRLGAAVLAAALLIAFAGQGVLVHTEKAAAEQQLDDAVGHFRARIQHLEQF